MKKVLTHIFVVLANFYILTYGIGLILMTITMLVGALNPMTGVFSMLGTLGLCLIFQFTRDKFGFQSFGENLICNIDKKEILTQTKVFTITRIPAFILMLLTLAISGNILDGLSEQHVYSIGNIFFFGLLTGCSYYGMKYFVNSSELLPILLLIAGLMLTGFAFKYSPTAQLTGDLMFKIYFGLSVAWLVIGLIYKTKRVKTINA